MNLEFAIEPYSKVKADPDMEAWTVDHWREAQALHHLLPLEIDHKRLQLAEDRGMFCVVTARYRHFLAGYVFWWIGTHSKSKKTVCGDIDVYWLHPEWRKGLNGYFLLKKSIELVKAKFGVKVVYARDKERGAIMRRLGFVPHEMLYVKEV